MTMKARVQGATLPGYTGTFTEAVDGLDYTWTCQASNINTPLVELWEKTTGITATASGFDCVWLVGDIGALTPGTYVLEFTGTSAGGVLKVHETVRIAAEVP